MKWYLCHLCVSSNSKSSKTTFFARFLWLTMKGIILRNTQLYAFLVNILRILYFFWNYFRIFAYELYIYKSMAKKDVNRLKIMLAVTKRSNKWLAEMLGKDQATISKWCTNTCQPDLETLIRISDLLKVNVNDLLNKECIKEWWTIYWNR